MRPYIVINGVKSTLVDGLLISDLPNIIKPAMRKDITEIDGRDGTVVTKLGYEAYEKEITIGLYGQYDIDRVVKYFNSSGTVIFSNEPDKYYNFEILDSIDFKKLIKWKTATVKFYVQPFKYSVTDTKRTLMSQILTLGSGSATANGITCKWNGNTVTLTGTASANTNFFIPINMKALAGSYTVNVVSNRSNGCMFRICKSSPINSQSLGGKAFAENAVETVEGSAGIYKYLFIYVPSGSQSASMTVTVNTHQVNIENRGNIYSRPIMTLYGSGQITLSINGNAVLSLEITDGSITLDGESMNAYKGNVLYNRHVLGDYANLVLESDENIVGWSGNVSRLDIEKQSRWI